MSGDVFAEVMAGTYVEPVEVEEVTETIEDNSTEE
jgi:hypothetical protein